VAIGARCGRRIEAVTLQTHETSDDRNARARLEPAVGPEPRASTKLLGSGSRLDTQTVLSLQRTAGNAGVTRLLDEERSPVEEVVGSGGGEPLDEQTRSFMENRFDDDFGDVRVHTGGRASESADSVDAHAYTVGSNVVFAAGAYEPGSADGRRLLAHELTHVVQQRSGPVSGTPAPGGILVSEPSDPFEQQAERVADTVAAGDAAPPAAPSAVQRAAEEEGEEVAAGGESAPSEQEGEEEEAPA
jgi:Domain of unknown function (DUF4157)